MARSKWQAGRIDSSLHNAHSGTAKIFRTGRFQDNSGFRMCDRCSGHTQKSKRQCAAFSRFSQFTAMSTEREMKSGMENKILKLLLVTALLALNLASFTSCSSIKSTNKDDVANSANSTAIANPTPDDGSGKATA